MKLALYLGNNADERWALARQMGVEHLVSALPTGPEGSGLAWDLESLRGLKQRVEAAGLRLTVIESSPPMGAIRLGLPERDAQIEDFCAMLRNLGALGVSVVCYNFMATFGWLRTRFDVPARGGALVTGYDHAEMESRGPTEAGAVDEERLWKSFEYFIQKVVPVAEEAKVRLALHPDDPPISPIRGVGRIFRSVQAMQRAIDSAPSPYSGITFCQGTFATMGADIPEAIRHFGAQEQIHFVHFRDIRGTAESFEETFHDEGPTDMLEAMRTYKEIGFTGPIRPDHVPTMAGESNRQPGYAMRGRLFAVGYMKGLMEAVYAR